MPVESARPEPVDGRSSWATDGVDRRAIESAFPVNLDRKTKVLLDHFNDDGSAQLQVQRRHVFLDFRPGRQSLFQWRPDGEYQLRQQGELLVVTPDRAARQEKALDEMMFGASLALQFNAPVMVYRPGQVPQFAHPAVSQAIDASATTNHPTSDERWAGVAVPRKPDVNVAMTSALNEIRRRQASAIDPLSSLVIAASTDTMRINTTTPSEDCVTVEAAESDRNADTSATCESESAGGSGGATDAGSSYDRAPAHDSGPSHDSGYSYDSGPSSDSGSSSFD